MQAPAFHFDDESQNIDEHGQGEMLYRTGRSGGRGVVGAGICGHSMPYEIATRNPRPSVAILNVPNPIDAQRVFHTSGMGHCPTWGYGNPVRSRTTKGLHAEAQRMAHPRHHTGAVLAPELTYHGMSNLDLGGQSTTGQAGAKRNADLMTRQDNTYLTSDVVHGGSNMGQQLAVPETSAWRSRRMYVDTQLMRPPSDPSDMAALLNNPFVARNWNYDNLQKAVVSGDDPNF
jgi:hypothetical protein